MDCRTFKKQLKYLKVYFDSMTSVSIKLEINLRNQYSYLIYFLNRSKLYLK